MCTMATLPGTSAAILMTDLIWATVPGLNTTWLIPDAVASPMSSTASSGIGDPRRHPRHHRSVHPTGAPCTANHFPPPAASTDTVQEQRVELNTPAGLEQSGQLGDEPEEDLLGDLRPTSSSAECPALAATATILASTVVGVIPG